MAGLLTSSVTRRLSGQAGITVTEILFTIVVLMIAIVPIAGALGAERRSTLVSQRTTAMIHRAQHELETLRARSYSGLRLSSLPAAGSGPSDPNSRVAGSMLQLPTTAAVNGAEPLVVGTACPGSACLDPTPTVVQVGKQELAVYRYVTQVAEACAVSNGGNPCGSGSNIAKRISVAVTVVPPNGGDTHPSKPYWLSSVVAPS